MTQKIIILSSELIYGLEVLAVQLAPDILMLDGTPEDQREGLTQALFDGRLESKLQKELDAVVTNCGYKKTSRFILKSIVEQLF